MILTSRVADDRYASALYFDCQSPSLTSLESPLTLDPPQTAVDSPSGLSEQRLKPLPRCVCPSFSSLSPIYI